MDMVDNDKKSEIDKVIDAHWEYNKGLLEKSLLIGKEINRGFLTDKILELCEYCYKTAWVHGAKHALEESNKKDKHTHRCFGHYTEQCDKSPCLYKDKCKEITDEDKEGL